MRECMSNSVSVGLRCCVGPVLFFLIAGAVNAQLTMGTDWDSEMTTAVCSLLPALQC